MQSVGLASNLFTLCGLKHRPNRRNLSSKEDRMSSAIRSGCPLSAENCCLQDNKVEEAVEEDFIASRSGIVRHVHGDTEASTVPAGKSMSWTSTSKRLLQRPSQPPPPPPCPSGDNADEVFAAAGEGQLMRTSTAQVAELNLQLQQLQQPRCKNRPGQRSPRRQTAASQQPLQPNFEDEEDEDEKDDAAAAAAVKTAVSSIDIPIDNVQRKSDDGQDRAVDVVPQQLREKDDASERECDTVAAAAAATDNSSEHADLYTHSADFQRNVVSPKANDEVGRWSSSGRWMKRPCGRIVEEASFDELLEKTEKLEQELRKQLSIKKQKTLENARKEERIGVLEQINAELRKKLTEAESELAKKDIRMAVFEAENVNLAKRLKSTQGVLTKLENDYERAIEEKLEFKSLYIDCRFKSSEAIGDLTEEINRQIEAKRSFIRLAQQNIPTKSGTGLKKALATTSDYLHMTCERNRLLDKVQYLKTKMEAQDLYIEDLSSAVKELSRIIQHYKVSATGMKEADQDEQEEHEQQEKEVEQEEEEDQSSMLQCAAMTEDSSDDLSPYSKWTQATSREADSGESEDHLNQEKDLVEELEDIYDEASSSDYPKENSDRSTISEFRTPLSSPSLSNRSQTSRQTADDDDNDEKQFKDYGDA